jgi:hypothetical protein
MTTAHPSHRPGPVIEVEGVVFQCDADDSVSGLFVRPLQELSRRLRGRPRHPLLPGVPLANHAGIRVRVACPDGSVQRYVVEQLNGTLVQSVFNALSWTPWRDFRARQGTGWDVTVPAEAFEGVEPADVRGALDILNHETGQPFYYEVCTAFIERVFGGHQLFDGIEILDRLVPGPGPRIPEPAAPRFKSKANLPRRARYLLRVTDDGGVGEPVRPVGQRGLGVVRLAFWIAAQIGRAGSLGLSALRTRARLW